MWSTPLPYQSTWRFACSPCETRRELRREVSERDSFGRDPSARRLIGPAPSTVESTALGAGREHPAIVRSATIDDAPPRERRVVRRDLLEQGAHLVERVWARGGHARGVRTAEREHAPIDHHAAELRAGERIEAGGARRLGHAPTQAAPRSTGQLPGGASSPPLPPSAYRTMRARVSRTSRRAPSWSTVTITTVPSGPRSRWMQSLTVNELASSPSIRTM